MKINSLEIFRYDLPLRRPVSITGQRMTVRSGLILEIKDGSGHAGFGEIAPLSGLHSENLDLALQQLLQLRPQFLNTTVPAGLAKLDGGFDRWLGEFKLLPSVRFGVELAILNLLSTANGIALHQFLFGGLHHPFVNVNGLLAESGNLVEPEAKRMMREGYRAVKIKVGRQALEEEIEIVRLTRKLVGENVTIRLDANRAWSFDDAVSFGKAVAPYRVEYMEEPLKDARNLPEFHKATGIAVALDESLVETPLQDIQFFPGLKAFVLKPDLLGGIENAAVLARAAFRQGVEPVFSATFQSGLGIWALAQLAAGLSSQDTAHGFDTYRWLEKDILSKPLGIKKGCLHLEQTAPENLGLRKNLLRPAAENVGHI